MSKEVDAHCAGEVGADGAQLATDCVADALLEIEVPRGAASHRHRERSGVADNRTTRPVGEADAWEADAIELGNLEEIIVSVFGAIIAPFLYEPLLADLFRRDVLSPAALKRRRRHIEALVELTLAQILPPEA